MILIVYTPIPLPSATGHHRKRKSFHSFLSNYQKRLLHKSRQTLNTTRTVFNGYFLVFSQQIAHRATHGETTGLLLVVPTFGDIFELYFPSCTADVVDSLSAHILQFFGHIFNRLSQLITQNIIA